MELILLIVGVTILHLAPICCWLDRRNFIVWLNLPSLFIAYFFQLALFSNNIISNFDSFSLYSYVVFWGGVSYLLGCILGTYTPAPSFKLLPVFSFMTESALLSRNRKICISLLILSSLCLVVAYLVMGFVPMFAANPLMAKFFKGVYKAPYDKVSILYRLGTTVIPVIMPLSIICLYKKFDWLLFSSILLSFLLMSLSLLRGAVGSSLIIGVLILIFFHAKKFSFMSWVAYFLVYCFGSSLMWLLGLAGGDATSLLAGIVSGAPDLTDQLSFLDAFQHSPVYTYGLTFIGGLIPSGYKWNPSVYTLSVLNDTDNIDNIASGGFRMLSPMWGYVSFSYIGVFLISFFHGVFTSFQVRFIKLNSMTDMTFAMAFLYSSVFIGFFVSFFTMSMYSLPLMVLVVPLIYIHKHKIIKARKG